MKRLRAVSAALGLTALVTLIAVGYFGSFFGQLSNDEQWVKTAALSMGALIAVALGYITIRDFTRKQ